jgi:hypothetical protein
MIYSNRDSHMMKSKIFGTIKWLVRNGQMDPHLLSNQMLHQLRNGQYMPYIHNTINWWEICLLASLMHWGMVLLQPIYAPNIGCQNPKLNHVNTLAQQCFLEKLRIVKQANIVKLIHGSIPTMASLLSQGQVTSPLCPRCLLSVETTQHILPCPYPQAIEC